MGPAAGWPPHTSADNSREIIRTVLGEPNTFAVTVKELGDTPVGSVGVFPSDAPLSLGEPEIGYWIGVPFWGQGLIPEAVKELQKFAFEELGLPLRLLLKGLKKSVAKKQGRSRQEEFMAGAFGASFDSASEEQAGPLIEYVRAL